MLQEEWVYRDIVLGIVLVSVPLCPHVGPVKGDT